MDHHEYQTASFKMTTEALLCAVHNSLHWSLSLSERVSITPFPMEIAFLSQNPLLILNTCITPFPASSLPDNPEL